MVNYTWRKDFQLRKRLKMSFLFFFHASFWQLGLFSRTGSHWEKQQNGKKMEESKQSEIKAKLSWKSLILSKRAVPWKWSQPNKQNNWNKKNIFKTLTRWISDSSSIAYPRLWNFMLQHWENFVSLSQN